MLHSLVYFPPLFRLLLAHDCIVTWLCHYQFFMKANHPEKWEGSYIALDVLV